MGQVECVQDQPRYEFEDHNPAADLGASAFWTYSHLQTGAPGSALQSADSDLIFCVAGPVDLNLLVFLAIIFLIINLKVDHGSCQPLTFHFPRACLFLAEVIKLGVWS